MNPFSGKPLRYLIGADAQGIRPMSNYATELPYDAPKYLKDTTALAPVIGYVNSLDEEFAQSIFGPMKRYGPYVHGDTADEWNEGQMIPGSSGWRKCLLDQFARWKPLAKYVEIDNLDSYPLSYCLLMFDMAMQAGFMVVVKNPLNVEGDHVQLLKHQAATAVIVEAYCGTCDALQRLRDNARKGDLPVWFVSNRAEKHWADERARALGAESPWLDMSVSWCESRNDYSTFMTLFPPRTCVMVRI